MRRAVRANAWKEKEIDFFLMGKCAWSKTSPFRAKFL